jgi:capsular polysaccharide transport system permease protein
VQQLTERNEPQTLELIAVDAAAPVAAQPQRSGVIGLALRYRGFLGMVVLPTLLASIYWLGVAANRYEAESKFIVRSPSTTATNQIANLVQGSSIVRSADDAFAVHAYMRSRDAVRALVVHAGLLERLNRPEADFFWRYPGAIFAGNQERLWRHFQSLLTVDYDHSTGISTLKVQAFRPEDARDLAEALLNDSEVLINRMSERAQGDAIQAAEREVQTSRAKALEAQERVTAFRNRVGMVDPGRVSTAALETIARLALEMAQTNAQAAELEKASPQSPQMASLHTRIAALDNQILLERQRLAGSDNSLAPIIASYDRLMLEREFAERTFTSALTSLETARLDAQHQRLFLERISSPQLPDYAKYPSRLLGIFVVFAIAYALYSILSRLAADTRAHAGM